jgi:NADP-dependent 3-hydroxy acid dehydrogenase YdfG
LTSTDPSATCKCITSGCCPSWYVLNAICFNRSDRPEELEAVGLELWQTNVVGNIHLIHLFLPLVFKGKVKKVIFISSGHADLDFTNALDVETSPIYTASKAAMNAIMSKFSVQYKKDGVLFLSISPGLVEVGRFSDGTYPCLQD